MQSYIKRISYDHDLFNQEDEFVTYDDEPFTGILYDVEGGCLVSEEGIINGYKVGFAIDYYPDGKVEGVQQGTYLFAFGIDAKWNREGELEYAKKQWGSLTVEELRMKEGKLIYQKLATEQEIRAELSSVNTSLYEYRQESIRDLLTEVEEKVRTSALFNDPRLLTNG